MATGRTIGAEQEEKKLAARMTRSRGQLAEKAVDLIRGRSRVQPALQPAAALATAGA